MEGAAQRMEVVSLRRRALQEVEQFVGRCLDPGAASSHPAWPPFPAFNRQFPELEPSDLCRPSAQKLPSSNLPMDDSAGDNGLGGCRKIPNKLRSDPSRHILENPHAHSPRQWFRLLTVLCMTSSYISWLGFALNVTFRWERALRSATTNSARVSGLQSEVVMSGHP
jgi:hypothetical protein